MKIGLLGFGVVGRGVYELTRGRDDMQVVKVLRREDMQLPDAKTVRDIRDIVEDDSIDTVVEVMGGLHPAYDYVRAAIEAGKNVVTANKALVCTFYDELLPLVQDKLRDSGAMLGGMLSGSPEMAAAMARTALRAMSQEKKDELLVQLVTKNRDKLLQKGSALAEKNGIKLHLYDVSARKI